MRVSAGSIMSALSQNANEYLMRGLQGVFDRTLFPFFLTEYRTDFLSISRDGKHS